MLIKRLMVILYNMKINKYFDNKTTTLKVSFEPELFSEEDLKLAKQDLLESGVNENDLNQEIDEVTFENSYLDECENCVDSEEVYGTEEDLNEDNFYLPEDSEYVTTKEVELNESEIAQGSEYQGRKVTLNKPFRTPGGPKKFSVYVKNDKDNIVKVNFGSPDMAIRRDEPARRKSFRARMRCDSPGPKWKARYWACKTWEAGKTVTEIVS